jgi:hypothetical protein
MEEINKAEIEIQVSISDTTNEELAGTTRWLLAEVRDLNVESVGLAKGGSTPEGSKGDSITMGTIVINMLPAVLPSLITSFKLDFARARSHSQIQRQGGQNMIEFKDPREELQKLITSLK